MASNRQVSANRQNALRSPGPTTSRGKQRVRHNAVTHGLFTNDILLPNEDPTLPAKLRERFLADYQPPDVGGEILIEVAVAIVVRWRRLFVAETARFAARVKAAAERRASEEAYRTVLAIPPEQRENLRRFFDRLLPKMAAKGAEMLGKPATPIEAERAAEADRAGTEADRPGEASLERPGTTIEAERDTGTAPAGEEPARAGESSRGKLATTVEVEGETEADRAAQATALADAFVAEEAFLAVVCRYDTGFARRFDKILHELERQRAARAGHIVTPRAEVDVDLTVSKVDP